LKVCYAKTRLGRLLPFLFIWQFILSGPLEIATGNIGFAQYAVYLLRAMTPEHATWFTGFLTEHAEWVTRFLAVGVGGITVLLLYRKIESVGKLMVTLWVGMIVTISIVLFCGLLHFDAKVAFDFPPGAFSFSGKLAFGLGAAMSIAMYDLFGYYSVCYIGDEVRDPVRVIPRSIFISVLAIAAVYFAMNVSLISVVPWREAMNSKTIGSDFMEQLYGRGHPSAIILTVLICWTALASVFALLLGYSRIPFAAARDGFFFSAFSRLHPRGDFPYISLLVMGAVSAVASCLPLGEVINALMVTRILVQFIAQIGAVALLRKQGIKRPGYRMALYPLPSIVALVGWVFIFATSGLWYIVGGLGTVALGVVAYYVWCRWWPTASPES
jgi:amino acid transporter